MTTSNGTAMPTSTRFIDLDAAIAALEPIQIRFRGELLTLPEDIPMDDAVRVLRAADDGAGEIDERQAALLFGDEVYARLKAGRIGVRTFVGLVQDVLRLYGLAGVDEPAVAGGWGEAPDPQ